MNQDFQLKLQAYLDGELSEREMREVGMALAGDAEAQALLVELRNTSGALGSFEADVKLPETREFYWSKIQRAIERGANSEPIRRGEVPFWRKLLIPSGAFAALVIAGLIALQQPGPVAGARSVAVETVLKDSGAMTYRDDAEGMTVVWLSYPAENEFADLTDDDTIQ